MKSVYTFVKESSDTITFNFESSLADEFVCLFTETKATAVILEGLVAADPQNPIIPKIVKGIMNKRNARGAWLNTHVCLNLRRCNVVGKQLGSACYGQIFQYI